MYFRLAIYPITVMDPILFRVVPPQKPVLCASRACMFYYVMDAHVRDICHETHVCLSVDQEVSLEVAQVKFGFGAPYSGVHAL